MSSLPTGYSILSIQSIPNLQKWDYSGPGLEFSLSTPHGHKTVRLAMIDPEAPETIEQLNRALVVMKTEEERKQMASLDREGR